jgi:hypothetical protein
MSMQIRVRDVVQLWIFPLPFEGVPWFCARDPSLRLKSGSGQDDAPQGIDTQDSDHNARLPSCITSVIASDYRAVKLGGFLL